MCAIFRRFLKRQGLKFTNERALILDAVLAKPSVFEADELLHERESPVVRVELPKPQLVEVRDAKLLHLKGIVFDSSYSQLI